MNGHHKCIAALAHIRRWRNWFLIPSNLRWPLYLHGLCVCVHTLLHSLFLSLQCHTHGHVQIVSRKPNTDSTSASTRMFANCELPFTSHFTGNVASCGIQKIWKKNMCKCQCHGNVCMYDWIALVHCCCHRKRPRRSLQVASCTTTSSPRWSPSLTTTTMCCASTWKQRGRGAANRLLYACTCVCVQANRDLMKEELMLVVERHNKHLMTQLVQKNTKETELRSKITRLKDMLNYSQVCMNTQYSFCLFLFVQAEVRELQRKLKVCEFFFCILFDFPFHLPHRSPNNEHRTVQRGWRKFLKRQPKTMNCMYACAHTHTHLPFTQENTWRHTVVLHPRGVNCLWFNCICLEPRTFVSKKKHSWWCYLLNSQHVPFHVTGLVCSILLCSLLIVVHSDCKVFLCIWQWFKWKRCHVASPSSQRISATSRMPSDHQRPPSWPTDRVCGTTPNA